MKLKTAIERMFAKEHGILVVLENHKTGKKRFIYGENLVTNDGDRWYAEMVSIGVAGSGSPTNAFAQIYLCDAGADPVLKTNNFSHFTSEGGTGNPSACEAGYPKNNCQEADNTGKGVDIVTWYFAFATSDGAFVDVTHCIISIASASGSDPILNGYKWGAAWSKDTDTSAKIFVNHEMLGA